MASEQTFGTDAAFQLPLDYLEFAKYRVPSELLDYRGVRALVTGATGFLGGWVGAMLSRAGAETVLSSRAIPVSENDRNPQIKWVQCDLTQPEALENLLAETQPDIVFNLAGYGVQQGERDESVARILNTELPKKLAVLLAQTNSPKNSWHGLRLVHAGSGAEYGSQSDCIEESTVCQPHGFYSITKNAGTEAVIRAVDSGQLRGVVARLFTIYGPGESPARLLSGLLQVGIARQPLKLTSGEHKRDFTFIQDVIEVLLRLGRAPDLQISLLNVPTGVPTRVRDFALQVAETADFPPSLLEFGALEYRPDELWQDAASAARLVEILGAPLPTSIQQGVSRTNDYLRSLA